MNPMRSVSAVAVIAFSLAFVACSPADDTPEGPEATTAATPASVDMGNADVKLPQLVCGASGFIQPDTTREKLAADHGAENLREETVAWVESEEMATILFPNDPSVRMELLWFGRTSGGPTHARVREADTQVLGPFGLFMGASLEDVERANGGPFELMGFQNHNAGEVTNWLGGKLDTGANAPCSAGLVFDFTMEPGAPELAAVTQDPEKRYRSDSPEMRAVKPEVIEYSLTFRQPE